MGQINRGTSFNRAIIERTHEGERRLGRRDRGLEEGTASADALSDKELVGMPPPVPRSWPRIFPGL